MNQSQQQYGSIDFSYDEPAHRRVVTFRGPINDRELLEAYGLLLGDPDYDASMDDFIDLRGVTHMGVTSSGLHRLITMFEDRESPGFVTRSAILAPTDVLYGVSRMFQTMRGDEHPDELEIFRSLDELLCWLDRRDVATITR
ncbi:MAG: hypothetical protein H7099_15670 [Gemmatimonadaceae bacterium]|nr:hypothetical protein [Gemmatimonadaceae bacterium]